MKKIFFVFTFLIIILSANSCSILEPLAINVNVQKWTTRTEVINSSTFGYVDLEVSGTTNADKLTIETYGDGLVSQEVISVVNGAFNKIITISFTHSADNQLFTINTKLTAYNFFETKSTFIQSGSLKY